MGLLLMQYEYQKAKQKCNVLELKGIRLHDQQELYTKRISNIEKLYSKKKSRLESRFSQMNSQLSSTVNSAAAQGTLNSSIFSSLGISTKLLTANGFDDAIKSAIDTTVGEANSDGTYTLKLDKNGKALAEDKYVNTDAAKSATKIQSIMNAAASQLISLLQSVLEAIKEAELAELEEMEDAQREPIAEKDAEIQADVAENDTLMTLAKERMEAAKGRLPDTVKGSVAHYGLS